MTTHPDSSHVYEELFSLEGSVDSLCTSDGQRIPVDEMQSTTATQSEGSSNGCPCLFSITAKAEVCRPKHDRLGEDNERLSEVLGVVGSG